MDEGLYETDFYTWTQRQAKHLRAGHLDRAGLRYIAEEIQGLGESQAAALRSAYRLIALHLLKLTIQPGRATRGRRATIVRETSNVERYLQDGPGLKPRRAALFDDAYRAARREASAETGSDSTRFPVVSPFTKDEVEDEDSWPSPVPSRGFTVPPCRSRPPACRRCRA